MELNFGNRYEVRRSIKELPLGTLYVAHDRSLRRSVLLYEIAPERTTTNAREAVKRGSAFTHDRFLHILDVGTEKGMPFAVFKACDGSLLSEELHRHHMRPQQLLTAVYELGKAMQDAAEDGIYGYSVCADNLWMGNGNTLMPIHYWDAADERRRGASGLCHLLYQLAARTDELPSSVDVADNRLRIALRTLPADTLEAVLALYRRAFREKLSLTAFLLELHGCLQPGEAQSVPERESEPADLPTPVPAVPAVPAAVPKAASHGHSQEDEEDDAPPARRNVWKRVALFAGAACIFTIVFIGGLTLIFHIANPAQADRPETRSIGSEPAAAVPTSAPHESAPGPNKSGIGPVDKDKPAQPAEAAPTTIPNLVGLTKGEAEKRALAAGLHYNFFIERNDAAKDTVFKQEPKAGDPAVKGGSVTFWVSKGM